MGNLRCIYFLLLWGRENSLCEFKQVPVLDSVGGETRTGPFPSGRGLRQGSCMTQKKTVQSFGSESISSQVSVSFAAFFWNLVLRNPGSLQEPAFLSITMLILLWLFLLRNFINNLPVSKPMSKHWLKYWCQILCSRRTTSILIPIAVEAPTFSPLSCVPAILRAAGVCARPEPRWGLAASPLAHGTNLCLRTKAQRDLC